MTPRFWLLQTLGWSLFALIAYLARPGEAAVPDVLALLGVIALSAGGMAASQALRWLQAGHGELRCRRPG